MCVKMAFVYRLGLTQSPSGHCKSINSISHCRIGVSQLVVKSRYSSLSSMPSSRSFCLRFSCLGRPTSICPSSGSPPAATRRKVSRFVRKALETSEGEEVFFDGGPHYGDLVTNILFGLTLVWLPLTMAAVFRALFLRYRFTNLRVTIVSGLTGEDRRDFSYEVIRDVKSVPRFIGEWGDLVIELKDGTKIDCRCVPRFREISKYVKDKAGQKTIQPQSVVSSTATPKGFS